jgi:PilZ domain
MPGPADRRNAERFPVNAATSCPFVSPVVENFGPVKIKNISTDGIGLIASRTVPAGTMMVVTLANQAKGISKNVMIRVAHVTPELGAFLIGGSFITPLSYDELSTFVL